jgi:hypothetical protein
LNDFKQLRAKSGVANFEDTAEVAELVDALDLGSSGAIRGGSSPPFRIKFGTKAFSASKTSAKLSERRTDETKKRDPGFFEEEKKHAAS